MPPKSPQPKAPPPKAPPSKAGADMPEDNKSREGLTGASKTPPKPAKTNTDAAIKAAARQARLGDALRANLRRRKAGGEQSDETMIEDAPEAAKESPKKEMKDD